MPKKITNTEFNQRAHNVHSNKYDYSLVQYISTYSPIDIVCPIHGNFTQIPKDHLAGAGCKLCGATSRAQTNLVKYGGHPQQNQQIRNKTKLTNLEKYGYDNPVKNPEVLKKIHNTMINKYGVSHPLSNPEIQQKHKNNNNIKYGVDWSIMAPSTIEKKLNTFERNYGTDNPRKSIKIIEKIKQTHIQKYGSHCKQQHNKAAFELLNNRDWLVDQYITQLKSAQLIGEQLGCSDRTVGSYLDFHVIEKRKYVVFSHSCIAWLNYVSSAERIVIQHAQNGSEFVIPGTRYKADGYCRETNTIYEFHGDYWHGNPNKYDSQFVNQSIGKTMEQLYQTTIIREQTIRDLGYNLIVIWESEWNEIESQLNSNDHTD